MASTPPVPEGLRRDRRTVVANRLNSMAIHLLRRIARTDAESGLTAERMSLLSVLAYGGAKTINELAAIERLSAPAVTRTVTLLEDAGLVRRERGRTDRRVVVVTATASGRRLMEQARARRIALLARDLKGFGREELAIIERAAELLAGLDEPETP